jgi:hypothetical protein
MHANYLIITVYRQVLQVASVTCEVMLLPPVLDEVATSPSCFTPKWINKLVDPTAKVTVTFPLCPSIILWPTHMVGGCRAQYTFNPATRWRPMTRFTPWPFFPRKGSPVPTGWQHECPYSHLDALEKRNISQLCWAILIPVIQPTARAPYYTDWTIPVWCGI